MAQQTALSVLGLPGPTHSFAAKAAAVGFVLRGVPFLYTAAEWGSGLWYLEVFMQKIVSDAHARLYDLDDASVVADSAISTSETDLTRVRSNAVSLTNGNEYRVQFGAAESDDGGAIGAALLYIE